MRDQGLGVYRVRVLSLDCGWCPCEGVVSSPKEVKHSGLRIVAGCMR
jgi:hypothetical protein